MKLFTCYLTGKTLPLSLIIGIGDEGGALHGGMHVEQPWQKETGENQISTSELFLNSQ